MSKALVGDPRVSLPAEQATRDSQGICTQSLSSHDLKCIPGKSQRLSSTSATATTIAAVTASTVPRRKSLQIEKVEANRKLTQVSAENKSTAIDAKALADRTAALHRLNGSTHIYHAVSDSTTSQSVTSTQPVLVRTYNSDMTAASIPSAAEPKTHQIQKGAITPHELPPLSAFSFQEILAAIDPDVRISIDTIAEICGRSKMSLANQYHSHLTPHGELHASNPGDPIESTQTILHQSLEPLEECVPDNRAIQNALEEASGNCPEAVHARATSTSLALLLTSSSNHQSSAITSVSMAEPSTIESHAYKLSTTSAPNSQSGHRPFQQGAAQDDGLKSVSQSTLLPNLLAWLQSLANLERNAPEPPGYPYAGKTATDVLREVLK
ncbi:hypothetical protein MMC06_003869 [Schaereria dolodes]|nr:hypothetical protein [Schaereria dolodes]